MTGGEIDYLWTLLGQVWGAKFYEQYGTHANEAWAAALASVSVDQAKTAIGHLIDSGSPFPPTLPEFVVLSRKYVSSVRIDANGRMISG